MQTIAWAVNLTYDCPNCSYETPQKRCYGRHIKQHDQELLEGYICPVKGCEKAALQCTRLLKGHVILNHDEGHVRFYEENRAAIDNGYSRERKELKDKMKCLLTKTAGKLAVKQLSESLITFQEDPSDISPKDDSEQPVAGYACPVQGCDTAALECTRLLKRHVALSHNEKHIQFYGKNRVAIDDGFSPERKELKSKMQSLIVKLKSRWKAYGSKLNSVPEEMNPPLPSDALVHSQQIEALENDLNQDVSFSFSLFEIFPALNDMLEEGEKASSDYPYNTRLDPFSCSNSKKQKTEADG